MGATKIMIIRHAEKPGTFGNKKYRGINAKGKEDKESLVTFGWERAGGIANLFYPTNGVFQNPALAKPDYIYAADSADKTKLDAKAKPTDDEPSQRPYQTIAALAGKLGLAAANINTSYVKKDLKKMAKDALKQSGFVLISWQHQDILPKAAGATDNIVAELLSKTNSTLTNVPSGPWPSNRYDMVLVFDRPSGTGPFETCTQVPQMLLAGDSEDLFPVNNV